MADRKYFYIPSLSANTLIYKGMLIADQIETMFPDLTNPDVESALALVHQRFSTNTFPSWPLAHPYRYVAHNGEINTLRGNINWMHAREAMCESELLGDDLKKILPVIREGGSDTATFDNVLEFLVMTGRSLPHAVLMMIPEPWAGHESMSAERKAFYEYHATMMEPWDGPASIAFTDGKVIGAVLDRNGLRPSRYYVTKDDLVVMASEVGVLEHPRREHPAERAAAPGPHLPGRHRAGAHHRRRRDQARPRDASAVRRMAEREHGRARRPEAGAAAAAARSLHDAEPAAHVRLHAGGSEDSARADGAERRRGDRIDGHRHRARRAVGQAAAALRLLHAAVRAGHEPAARRHPRRAGDVDGLDDRPRSESPEARARGVPPDQGEVGDRQQRRAGAAAPHRRARLQIGDAADALRRRFGRHRPRARARGSAAAHERGGRRGLHDHHPVGPRREHEARADSEPARDGGRAPSSGARGDAQSRGARHRDAAKRAKCIIWRCSSATAPAR